MKMVVEIVVTGLRKKAHFIYQFKIFLFNPPKKKKQPLTSPQACTRDQKKLKETYKKNKSVVRSPSQQQLI